MIENGRNIIFLRQHLKKESRSKSLLDIQIDDFEFDNEGLRKLMHAENIIYNFASGVKILESKGLDSNTIIRSPQKTKRRTLNI